MRHQRADAAWSSGRGAPVAVWSRVLASMPVRASSARWSCELGGVVVAAGGGDQGVDEAGPVGRVAVLPVPRRASSSCCHRAWALAGWVGPVGRWSLSGTLLAARQTARSPSRSGAGAERPGGHQGGVFAVLVTRWRTSVARLVTSSDRAFRYGPHCGSSRRSVGMPGSQGSGPVPAGVGSSRRQSRTAARSSAESSSRALAASRSAMEGSVPLAASSDEVGAQRRPCGVVCDARNDLVSCGLEVGDRDGTEMVFGGDVEGVEVAGGGGAEPQGGGGVLAGGGGGRDRGRRRGRGCPRGCPWRSGGEGSQVG